MIGVKKIIAAIVMFLSFAAVGIKGCLDNEKHYDNLIQTSMNGKLKRVDLYSRDQWLVVIEQSDKQWKEYLLNGRGFAELNGISPSDSISKKTNDEFIKFFKLTDGQYEFCCELKIW
jgi:hypothetical protein